MSSGRLTWENTVFEVAVKVFPQSLQRKRCVPWGVLPNLTIS